MEQDERSEQISALYDEQFYNLGLTVPTNPGLFQAVNLNGVSVSQPISRVDDGPEGFDPLELGPVPSNASGIIQFLDSLGLKAFNGTTMAAYFRRRNSGGANTIPPRELWPNIAPTMAVVQAIADILGGRVIVNSSYRAPGYNRGVGGATHSTHMQFKALDFNITGSSPSTVQRVAKQQRGKVFTNPYTKTTFTFSGGIGTYPNFTHLDTRGSNQNW